MLGNLTTRLPRVSVLYDLALITTLFRAEVGLRMYLSDRAQSQHAQTSGLDPQHRLEKQTIKVRN